MRKKSIFRIGITAISLLTITTFISCDNDETPVDATDEVSLMIEEVRTSTQNYKVHSEAVSAGWNTDLSGCVSHPSEGGMGHHFGRMEYIDGEINHLEPEVLLYAPDENGDMEFLGVEYMVPFALHSQDEEPPVLFDQSYHKNQEIEMWTLHLWSEKENPSGIFYDWNPNVSCN